MTISSEQNPVDTIRLILDDDGNTWSDFGSEPDYIERIEKNDMETKLNRANNGKTAVYVWSPDVATITPYNGSAPDYRLTEVVQCNVMAKAESDTSAILSDVINLLFDYYVDSESSTQWMSLRPSSPSDDTGGGFYPGSHSESNVQVVLEGLRST